MTTTGGVSFGRALELKTRDEGWTCEGHVSVFGNVDSAGDVVVGGAYKQTLADGHPVRFLFSHQPDKVLGKTLELYEDSKGLFGRFKLSRTSLGQDVRQLLLDGAVDSFSVGYIARDWSTDQKSGVRSLRQIDLLECSIVALPANVEARVTSAKSAQKSLVLPHLERYVAGLRGTVARLEHRRRWAGMSWPEVEREAAAMKSRLPGAKVHAAPSGGR